MAAFRENDGDILNLDIVKEEYIVQEDLTAHLEFEVEPVPESSHGLDVPTIKQEESSDQFNCPECKKPHQDRSSLALHIRYVHQVERRNGKEVPFHCSKCSKTFACKNHLENHMKTHSHEFPICGICNKKFKNQRNLRCHLKTHESPRFKCKDCDQFFATKTNLRFHTQKIHQGLSELEISGQMCPCEFCGKEFPSKRTLCWHRYHQHMKIKKYECPDCSDIFNTKTALKNHIKSTHRAGEQKQKAKSSGKIFCCSKCPRTFPAKNHLTSHMKVHTFHDSLTCERCGKTYKNRVRLMTHLKTHNGPKFECKECGKLYTRQLYVRLHTLKVHYGLSGSNLRDAKPSKRVTCEICGKEFASRDTLKKHQSCHSSERKFECPECHTKYKRSQNLSDHMKTVHSTHRPFACNICSKKFKLRNNLNDHLKTHEDKTVNQIPCKICGKKVRKHSMIHHMKMHRELKFECEKCGMIYRTKRSFKIHFMRVHLKMSVNEICGKNISCGECGREFYHMVQLRRHMPTHNTVRDFKCPLCPKSFKSNRDCKYHVNYYHSTQRSLCGVCGKTFKTPESLSKHQRNCRKVAIKEEPAADEDSTTEDAPEADFQVVVKMEDD